MGSTSATMARPYGTTPYPGSTTTDPFATHPVRKAVGMILAGAPAAILTFSPHLLDWLLQVNPVVAGFVGISMALSIATWAGLVFGVIILFICAIEGIITAIDRFLTRHLTPVDRLAVSERVSAMLHRRGYHTAEQLAVVPDAELRSHPNFDDRLLREVARALYLWEQERRDMAA
ncbi:MAG: hypothetical protein LC793_10250 [Thermomicrobia bacterium]|nr:hypothetical protein [Thermomicrobia bacterium]MCA1724289.1 hypothetical protein [Thermomicrobia bacterium]